MENTKPAPLTRKELHEFVWREPRTKLAKMWGISDVAIGKLCVKASVPAPPLGYWAKRAAGGKTSITPLPMRLPGQRETVNIRAVSDYERWNAPVDLEAEIPPPTYSETLEEVVQAAFALLGPFRAKRDLSEPHRGVCRVLLAESSRAEKLKERDWTYDKPRYQEPRFQRQLRLFSSIFYILDPLHAGCAVFERETWVQGIGQFHDLTASFGIGDSIVQLQFLEPENPKGHRDVHHSSVTTLRIKTFDQSYDFADELNAKIERRLEEIVKTILVLLETRLRSDDFAHYERKLQRKREMLHEIAERKRKEEEMRLAAIKARKEAIRREISNAAANLRQAQDIRRLVEAMAAHPDWMEEGRSKYLSWSEVALAEADAIDPMLQPIDKCFNAWKSEPKN